MNTNAAPYLALVSLMTIGCVSATTGITLEEEPPGPVPVNAPPSDAPHELLSEWGLFTDLAALTPNTAVYEFAPASPLYADYTTQRRFVWIPDGTTVGYDDANQWDLPEGTILAKTFAYPLDVTTPSSGERKLETRLLLNLGTAGWKPYVYLWAQDQQDATREIAGETLVGDWKDDEGKALPFDYSVPNTNECAGCHGLRDADGGSGLDSPLGMITAQLNTDFAFSDGTQNQVERFASMGWFTAAPELTSLPKPFADPFGSEPVIERVRSYFDSNCAHCHKDDGLASSSSLWLDYGKTDPDSGNPTHWGVCKIPVSAGGGTCGLTYDVVPGNAEQSVLLCRVNSAIPKERMPAMGTRVPHAAWVALVRKWINAMPADDCGAVETDATD